MQFLSISIDLLNSVKTKFEILSTTKNVKLREKKIAEYFQFIVNIESNILKKAFELNITEKFFLVKSIGDELWYIVDLADYGFAEQREIARDLSKFLQKISSSTQTMTISENFDEEEKKTTQSDINSKQITLGLKVTIDLIENAYNFATFRENKLNKEILKLIRDKYSHLENGKKNAETEYIERISEISHNFGLGYAKPILYKKRLASVIFDIRYDLIGIEIDRFFRISKFSLPGILTCGENLFSKYLKDSLRTSTKNQNQEKDSKKPKFTFAKFNIKKGKLKGYENNYSIYYLPEESITYQEDIYLETRKILIKYKLLSL